MKRIIECVPNFSEGRNKQIINAIVESIANTECAGEKVKVLDVDPGQATNRTVVTFVGSPEAVWRPLSRAPGKPRNSSICVYTTAPIRAAAPPTSCP